MRACGAGAPRAGAAAAWHARAARVETARSRRAHVLLVVHVPAADKLAVKLLQEPVLHHVDLVAKGPGEDGGVLAVRLHLLREPVRHLLPICVPADRRRRRTAKVERDDHAQVMVHRVPQEEHVVGVLVPAVDADGVRTHRLNQRQIAPPHERVLVGEVVAIRPEEHRLVDRHRRIAHAAHVEGLAIDIDLAPLHNGHILVRRLHQRHRHHRQSHRRRAPRTRAVGWHHRRR